MKTFFIEEDQKRKKILGVFKKIEHIGNKIIINKKINKLNLKSKIKIVNKIIQILKKENVRQVAVEEKLKKEIDFINLINSNNINICNPKWVLIHCTDKIIDLILNEKKIEKKESEISICVNEVDNLLEEYIYKFAKEFKRVNIITNHIGKFKKMEEKLYNEDGIILNITNNRKKGLTKSDIILNVDFPKESLNEFNIFDKSIIINWDEHLKIRKKRFNGKIIEEINIKISEDSEIRKFIEQNNLQNYDERDICQVLGTTSNIEIIIS